MASSSAIQPREKYDVFISFRGTDTRQTFTSHLYDALIRRKIDAYIDNRLERGDEIGSALLKAIEGSKIFVIIFSKDYASSTWCLDELVHIMDCKERYKRIVIPIFYNIAPAVVRHQTESYADAFAKHKSRVIFREEKLVEWKCALKTAANLSGFHSTSTTVRDDSDFVEKIVKDILTKLNRGLSSNLKGLVGVESRIQQILLLLCNVPDEIHIRSIGIWGMGGIGKTTLANAVFHELSSQFEACCFLANVRETSATKGGFSPQLYNLRDILLRKLLGEGSVPNQTTLTIEPFVNERLQRTKVLIVLDDVDDSRQLEFLVGDQVSFGSGSRIIITTRDMQQLREMEVLRNGVDHDVKIYKVEELKGDEARQLFYLNAPRDICSAADSKEFLMKVIDYATGNPLALKIWRSLFFRCKRKEDLEDLWNKLKKFPHKDLQNVCRISFEALGKNEREIFLDIVCFHKNQEIGVVKTELDACGLFSNNGIEILIDMSLISIKDERLWIHDVIQEFGWDIVQKDCPEEAGKRTRLHTIEDISHVLEKATGTEMVKSICLNTWKIKEIKLTHPQVFTRMRNLIFLKFYGLRENDQYISLEDGKMDHFLNHQSFPDSLRYLHWVHYPLKSLPSQFSPENLVELHMPYSKLQRLWNEGQSPTNLKRINLVRSEELVEIPDLSKSENIESIDLRACRNLVQVPEILEPMEHLEVLRLSQTSIKQLPESIGNLVGLKVLQLRNCRSLESIPPLGQLTELTSLDISYCKRLQSLPEVPCLLKSLDASGCTRLKTVSYSMTAITQGSDQIDVSYQSMEENHTFFNCEDLEENGRSNIMNDARLRIMRMATVLSKRKDINQELFKKLFFPVRVICPYKEIPEWFSYQTYGSSININLPPHSCDENFLGFALCASWITVYVNYTYRTPSDIRFECRYNFKFNNGQCQGSNVILGEQEDNGDELGPDHLYMWYHPFEIFDDAEWCTEASFEFSAGDEFNEFVVFSCGVCLLYAQGQGVILVQSEIGSDPGASKIPRPKKKTQTPGYHNTNDDALCI